MRDSKSKTIIKWVYAYVDIIYKAFPAVVVIFIAPTVIKSLLFHKLEFNTPDFLRLMKDINDGPLAAGNELFVSSLVFGVNCLFLLFLFLCLKKLRLFIKNVFEGNPFCIDNGRHLNFIGTFICVLILLLQVTKVALAACSFTTEAVSGLTKILLFIMGLLSVVFNPYFYLGLLIIVLGAVIIHGAEIKQENDLTV